ncbi:ankyrin repeat, PH and SEC7 domain containing protein secG-like [Ylistrum balloti]|uniref:ankyrin repeat, PH and SEC7 domain containing protein secG-like n=1 Tax=Ylistrum balloti TaxID=509963 RepID=UPI002905B108|nr:ankyrin repeat, PH and SEC7 domain containing protein secG-like [Ylistrum balloti]
MAGSNPFENILSILNVKNPETIACSTSDLHKAATRGDVGLLRKCLEQGEVDINLEDELGNTPLYMATTKGHRTAVDILLQNGAAVNDTSCSPLFEVKDAHIANALVQAGGRLGDRDAQGNTPLHRAVTREDTELVYCFIELGADTNARNATGNTPLHNACQHKKDGPVCEMITRLIQTGVTVNTKDKVGKTPLHHACESFSMFESISILIKHGAALDIHDGKGYCPIHYLIEGFLPTSTEEETEFVSKLDVLLSSSDAINLTTKTGLSSVHIAASAGLCIVIKHLVQRGCDIRCQDGRGKNALHVVASAKEERNNVHTTQTLISCGCDVECSDFWGSTPLHEAIANDKFDVVELLVNNGADVEARDNIGTSTLHIAAAKCSSAIPLLLSKGATVNATNKYLSAPLHFAAWTDSWSAVETLIRHGADQEMKDVSGCTPLNTALFTHSESVAEILKRDDCSTSVKAFSNVANKLMSKTDFDNLFLEDGKITRTDKDITSFCKRVFNTHGVGQVLFEDEARDIQSAVENIAENIVQKLAELDPKFKATLLRAGSSSEGTKTKFPNEFDFMFCLKQFSENTYPTFQATDEMRSMDSVSLVNRTSTSATLGDLLQDTEFTEKCATVSDYIEIHVHDTVGTEQLLDLSVEDSRQIPCYMMYHQFGQLLTNILLGNNFPKHPNLLIKEVTIEPALSLQWRGSRYKMMDIIVDLVPAIQLPCWPEKIRRDCNLLTPDILQIPGMAVSKMVGDVAEDLWRCSMSLQETAIFRKLQPCVRNSYTVAKALLNSTVVCPLGKEEETEETAFIREFQVQSMTDSEDGVFVTVAEKAIPSYFLKMMFLLSLEDKAKREGLGSVYESDPQTDVCGALTTINEQNTDPDKSSPPVKRKKNTLSYGPAEVRNIQRTAGEIDIDLVRDIYHRCEACLCEGKVPSFFNPRQDVLGSRGEEHRMQLALNYVKFINKLLDD